MPIFTETNLLRERNSSGNTVTPKGLIYGYGQFVKSAYIYDGNKPVQVYSTHEWDFYPINASAKAGSNNVAIFHVYSSSVPTVFTVQNTKYISTNKINITSLGNKIYQISVTLNEPLPTFWSESNVDAGKFTLVNGISSDAYITLTALPKDTEPVYCTFKGASNQYRYYFIQLQYGNINIDNKNWILSQAGCQSYDIYNSAIPSQEIYGIDDSDGITFSYGYILNDMYQGSMADRQRSRGCIFPCQLLQYPSEQTYVNNYNVGANDVIKYNSKYVYPTDVSSNPNDAIWLQIACQNKNNGAISLFSTKTEIYYATLTDSYIPRQLIVNLSNGTVTQAKYKMSA